VEEALRQAGAAEVRVEAAEPNLEDVFLALAARAPAGPEVQP
jgi:hypothetical protein